MPLPQRADPDATDPRPRTPYPGVPAPTARLRLRRFGPFDLEALQAMHRDPRVRECLVDDHPLDDDAVARRFLQGLQRVYAVHPGLGIWRADRRTPPCAEDLAAAEAAVAAGELDRDAANALLADTWAFCGWFNLMPMPHDPARVEIGCRLLPQAWGGGLALEGGGALLRHAFDTLALGEVWGVCHPQHRSVHAVLLTLGFAPQGVCAYDDVPQAAHFRLTRRDWQQAMQQPPRLRRRQAVQALQALQSPPPGASTGSHVAHGATCSTTRLHPDTPAPGSVPGCPAAALAVNSGA